MNGAHRLLMTVLLIALLLPLVSCGRSKAPGGSVEQGGELGETAIVPGDELRRRQQ